MLAMSDCPRCAASTHANAFLFLPPVSLAAIPSTPFSPAIRAAVGPPLSGSSLKYKGYEC